MIIQLGIDVISKSYVHREMQLYKISITQNVVHKWLKILVYYFLVTKCKR